MPSCAICSASLALRVMRQLLGIAARISAARLAPHRLDVGLLLLPHVVDGRLVGDVEVALERLVDDTRAGADVAVVEVDDGAVERERLLDLAPVVSSAASSAGVRSAAAAVADAI